MAQTSPPAITTPPTAPSRSAPSTFASLADAWLAWEEDLAATEMPAVATNVYNNAVDCYNNAVAGAASAAAALVSQNAAATSANTAATSAGASIWVSGNNYAIGDARWSPSNRYVYRCIATATGRTTDPSTDTAYWALAGTSAPGLVIVSATTRTMTANEHAVLTNASASTATLPATPTAGDVCWVTVGNARFDNVIARNGSNIMSLAQDLTVNSKDVTVWMRYINSSLGWVIL